MLITTIKLHFIFQVVALKVKQDGVLRTWNYEQYYAEVQLVARGFIHLGLQRHHAVTILGQNSPEWVIADLGAIFAGWEASIFFYLDWRPGADVINKI